MPGFWSENGLVSTMRTHPGVSFRPSAGKVQRAGRLSAPERDQRAHRHVERLQLGGAAEFGQVDDEHGGDDVGAGAAQQLDCALRRAAGGDEIVDQQHALALDQRVGVHLHLVDAVFQAVGDESVACGSLPFLRIGTKPAES